MGSMMATEKKKTWYQAKGFDGTPRDHQLQ